MLACDLSSSRCLLRWRLLGVDDRCAHGRSNRFHRPPPECNYPDCTPGIAPNVVLGSYCNNFTYYAFGVTNWGRLVFCGSPRRYEPRWFRSPEMHGIKNEGESVPRAGRRRRSGARRPVPHVLVPGRLQPTGSAATSSRLTLSG